ncbi:hypothetical protein [Roseivirga sp.]|uniref:hypothetical protein n=1 Tax=Roseivirga sp. TaxID=1964215 RepID=UPI003B5204A4
MTHYKINTTFFRSTIILCFGLYWTTTIVFVSPDNYINVSLLKFKHKFETYFYQQWGFFAPPPKYNDRLYYYFISDLNNEYVLRYEVIEDLQVIKSKKAPFNSTEDILDYILSSSLHAVNDGLVAVKESLEYELNNGLIEALNDSVIIEEGRNFIQQIKSFETLFNYGQIVAKKNSVPKDFNKVVIEISHVEMPKFYSRSELQRDSIKSEKVIFRSDTISLFNP